jgi:hypothetical protein
MTIKNDCERLVAIELLGRPRGRERERLYGSLRTYDRQVIDTAIASLEAKGLLTIAGARVIASEPLRHLERLELVAV